LHEHLIERSILMTSGGALKNIVLPVLKSDVTILGRDYPTFTQKTINENEREHILNTLRICIGRINGQGGAAQILLLYK
jgi:formate hydrogenlyase transcriptional activator